MDITGDAEFYWWKKKYKSLPSISGEIGINYGKRDISQHRKDCQWHKNSGEMVDIKQRRTEIVPTDLGYRKW